MSHKNDAIRMRVKKPLQLFGGSLNRTLRNKCIGLSRSTRQGLTVILYQHVVAVKVFEWDFLFGMKVTDKKA